MLLLPSWDTNLQTEKQGGRETTAYRKGKGFILCWREQQIPYPDLLQLFNG